MPRSSHVSARAHVVDPAVQLLYSIQGMKIAVTGSSGLIGSALRARPRRSRPRCRAARSPRPGRSRRGTLGHRRRHDRRGGTAGGRGDRPPGRRDHRPALERRRQEARPRLPRRRHPADRRDRRPAAARARPRLRLRDRVLRLARRRDRRRELTPRGTGFLADVVEAWEAAAEPARAAGLRTVHLRQGIVLSKHGGALQRLLLPFRLGVGGRVGSGRQWWSWVSLDDAVAAYPVRARAAARRAGQRDGSRCRHEPGVRQGARPGAAPPHGLPAAVVRREGGLRQDGRGDAPRRPARRADDGSRPQDSRSASPRSTPASRARSPADRPHGTLAIDERGTRRHRRRGGHGRPRVRPRARRGGAQRRSCSSAPMRSGDASGPTSSTASCSTTASRSCRSPTPRPRPSLDYDRLELGSFERGAIIRADGRFRRLADPRHAPVRGLRALAGGVVGVRDGAAVLRAPARLGRRDDDRGGPAHGPASPARRWSGSSLRSCAGIFLEERLSTSSRFLDFVLKAFAGGPAALPNGGMGADRERSSRKGSRSARAPPSPRSARTPSRSSPASSCAPTPSSSRPPASSTSRSTAGTASRASTTTRRPRPIPGPWLVVNGEGGPINNLCVPSEAAPGLRARRTRPRLPLDPRRRRARPRRGRAPAARLVRHRRWRSGGTCGRTASRGRCPPTRSAASARRRCGSRRGLYACGDHREHPSLNGALASGRRAAEAVLADSA